jgi:hypothetical protein
MKRWNPPVELTLREERLLKLAGNSRKLFVFLRLHRHRLFSEEFQARLESAYRQTGQGAEPIPPAQLGMALLLQGYMQVSDAEVIRLSGTDRCWRMLLGILDQDDDEAPFSQGTFQQYRDRFFQHDLDRLLLERTVELAKETKEFDYKKLPKTLRLAVDSRPFEGAGRVEDTFNLLGHAARKLAECAAKSLGTKLEEVCQQAATPLFAASSVKAGLDINWNDPEDKAEALVRLCKQTDRLMAWVERHLVVAETSPLSRYIEALAQVKAQDVEKGPDGRVQLKQGVAEDRRISIEDAEMRHGRKSKQKRFNGYKQHLATDLDSELIMAGAVTPANRPEEEATPSLQEDLKRQGYEPDKAYLDRAFVNSTLAEDTAKAGGQVVCKPWSGTNSKPGLFGKRDFHIDVKAGTITCPNGQVEAFEPGEVVAFDPEVCGACPIRARCTNAATGRGRTVTMGEDEALQKRLRRLQETRAGRQQLRERVGVEHRLAHLANRQGPKARYWGLRKNTFDLRRMASVQNLETIARRVDKATQRAA